MRSERLIVNPSGVNNLSHLKRPQQNQLIAHLFVEYKGLLVALSAL